MTIRVLLCDDEALLRAGLALILGSEADMEVVGEAGDGAAGVEAARRLRPDVVLMDLRMPGADGVEATRALAGPGVADPVPVLILSTYELDDDVVRALRAGASGYVLKGAPPEDLARAVRAVVAGDAVLAPSVTRRLLTAFTDAAPPRRDAAAEASLAALTPREREILGLIARGLSNQDIASALVVSLETVRTHVKRILTKLGVHDRVQAVVLAHRAGLVR